MSAENRVHPRVATHLSVELKPDSGDTLITEEIRNISLGGVFVSMADPLPYGSKLTMRFALPTEDACEIECVGEVVWSTMAAPDWIGAESGIGVKLVDVGLENLEKLAAYIKGAVIF
ncbi:MAG: PilZ domain-containing protein [Myxococcota bacterium]